MITPGLTVSDFEYDLPPERIARYPVDRRDESRLLVVSRETGFLRHLIFREVGALFRAGDVLVVNESRVLPCRLLGKKPTGAPAEILLLRPSETDPDGKTWEALVRPGGKLKPGRIVEISESLTVEVLDSAPDSGRVVRLVTDLSVEDALEAHGHVPLPPYLERGDEPLDRERYQTVYARVPGSVAAPTAGLHFTEDALAELESLGVQRARITLDIGVGTFRPIDAERPEDHVMHPERFHVPEAAAETINLARTEGRRVWAVGTTVVRTLESVARADGWVRPGRGATDLFVHPPFSFRVVDCLLTNFHLPRSTLLMLVSAFGGHERIMEAYRTAVEEGYRFYSYGDAMGIV
jgi:S-adenosylmethionine:tRNA ribosyltransferase-isomerase